jgi:hypothetical protein
MNKKSTRYIYTYIPVVILLVIQAIDRDGSYRIFQYLLLLFMVFGLIYFKFFKRAK